MRNVDPSCDDPQTCGYCAMGCQKGCKQSTLKTFLQDASDAGARAIVGAHADRILVSEDGRAAGIEATVSSADGSSTTLTVSAPTVVVACGSIESPALLLRSKIGGPAVGKHLRLHPATIVNGIYDERVEPWVGQIQSEVSDHFADCDAGGARERVPDRAWRQSDGLDHVSRPPDCGPDPVAVSSVRTSRSATGSVVMS